MSYFGKRNWPPIWTQLLGPAGQAVGELGNLQDVRLSAAMNSRYFITIKREGAIYLTSLDFDDENFCRQFVDLLKQHYGEPLTAIGDLEVV
jgi:hypothetical protein